MSNILSNPMTSDYEVRAITTGPRQHLFGYYDKCCWNASQRYILAHEISFGDRRPTGEDTATLGVVDLEGGNVFRPFANTRAWSWQQGCMLQWSGADSENTIVYNDRRDDRFVGVVYDRATGNEKMVSYPVAALSPDGSTGLSLNFARLAVLRPGYGYEGLEDPYANEAAAEEDGIYRIEMNTGQSEQVISLAQVAAYDPESTSIESL